MKTIFICIPMLKCLKRILILAYFQTSLLMSKTTHCKHCKTIQICNANMANMDKTLRFAIILFY